MAHSQQIRDHFQRNLMFCLLVVSDVETKGQTFRGIPVIYSTSVIFSAYLVALKYEDFATPTLCFVQ